MRHFEIVDLYEENRRLQNELYHARYNIIDLMSKEVKELLHSFHSCKSREETYIGEHSAAETIISLAKRIPPKEGAYFSHRAYCPLCGDGSSSPYASGFSIPEGLRRHLVGWGNNRNQCPVFGAAMSLARDYWYEQFHEQEEAKAAEKAAHILERRKTETLYNTAPNEKPELIDENIYHDAPRNDDELA
ncbi:MAG TPA: hypothetical protein VGB17_16500 [Pyrinomonadaceae bacterium]|jgi:formate dehydrogenase maturation protein FdhE